jgi:2-polyprenyl-6-hydroxyphenyl methylase/3-demethylubiquinone-9 3-methyltransferase
MRRLKFDPNWPDSWKTAYRYDELEIWKVTQRSNRGHSLAYGVRMEITLQLIYDVLPPGARILDIAAAQGNYSLQLAEQGYDVVWNDLRSDLEGYVRLKHEFGKLHYSPGNAFEIVQGEKFDCVLIAEIIEHVAHPDDFLKKVASLLKPEGYIVMSTPNGGYFLNDLPKFSECSDPGQYESFQFKPDGDGHIFLLHPDEIHLLAKQTNLNLEKHVLFTNPLTVGHVKMSFLLPFLPDAVVRLIEQIIQSLPLPILNRISANSASRFQKNALHD